MTYCTLKWYMVLHLLCVCILCHTILDCIYIILYHTYHTIPCYSKDLPGEPAPASLKLGIAASKLKLRAHKKNHPAVSYMLQHIRWNCIRFHDICYSSVTYTGLDIHMHVWPFRRLVLAGPRLAKSCVPPLWQCSIPGCRCSKSVLKRV